MPTQLVHQITHQNLVAINRSSSVQGKKRFIVFVPVGHQDEALPGAAHAPWPAQLTLVLPLASEREDRRSNVAVAPSFADFQPGQKANLINLELCPKLH